MVVIQVSDSIDSWLSYPANNLAAHVDANRLPPTVDFTSSLQLGFVYRRRELCVSNDCVSFSLQGTHSLRKPFHGETLQEAEQRALRNETLVPRLPLCGEGSCISLEQSPAAEGMRIFTCDGTQATEANAVQETRHQAKTTNLGTQCPQHRHKQVEHATRYFGG